METIPRSGLRAFLAALIVLAVAAPLAASAQMHAGNKMTDFNKSFGLPSTPPDYTVLETAVKIGPNTIVNLLQPGETAELTLHFVNKSAGPIDVAGHYEVIRYKTSMPPNEIWVPAVTALETIAQAPITIKAAAKGATDITITPKIGDQLGGYAVIVDLPGHGRAFAATLVRSLVPDQGRFQFPTYALDATWDNQMNEGIFAMFQRLGVKGMRHGTGFEDPGKPREEADARLHQYLGWAAKYDVTVMLTLSSNSHSMAPLGESRSWLTDDNKMFKHKEDYAWLPAYDDEFQAWVHTIAKDYGWPKGNVNAMELWNEPWEGTSISGWQADIPRYQEIFTHMAQGIEQARAQDGTRVLIGGTCSSANARDKLFADGSDKYLKWLDYVSIHYQAMAADPILVPEWQTRKSPYGPTRVWDTESWIANSEDRFGGVIASMRAQGQSRTAGIFGGNVYDSQNLKVDGKIYPVIQMYPPAAAVAATTKFIGQREFDHLLMGEGLPWVFLFKPQPGKPEDGTMVVVGDLAQIYEAGRTPFRNVKISPDARLTLRDPQHILRTFDFYGNPLPAADTITIPLDGRGFFIRASGAPGSFAKAQQIVASGQIAGVQPVDIVAHDFIATLANHPTLKVTLTNVLNTPVKGTISATSPGLTLSSPAAIQLAPHEIKDVSLDVSGKSTANNLYPVHIAFASPSGAATHDEDLHVNLIAHKTITVDGDLSDWNGVLPQVLPGASTGVSLTEKAYLPYEDFGSGAAPGSSAAYMAYDDQNFYFAAKVVDTTEDEGMMRFETRDDDSFFYPDKVTDLQGKEKTWPAGVRHFTYRKDFNIPSSGAKGGGNDNIQIAFNVVDQKPWYPNPPGTIPRFITYWDTDYEFALNKVAPQYGGGYEVWRLLAPGIPHKNFFPREDKSPIDGGPVKDAKLAIVYKNGIRFVEAAIPWHEIPEVRARILAGKTIKFSCRINDNAAKNVAHELATERSVSKSNSFTFHNSWQTHWSNELEFAAEPTTAARP